MKHFIIDQKDCQDYQNGKETHELEGPMIRLDGIKISNNTKDTNI